MAQCELNSREDTRLVKSRLADNRHYWCSIKHEEKPKTIWYNNNWIASNLFIYKRAEQSMK